MKMEQFIDNCLLENRILLTKGCSLGPAIVNVNAVMSMVKDSMPTVEQAAKNLKNNMKVLHISLGKKKKEAADENRSI